MQFHGGSTDTGDNKTDSCSPLGTDRSVNISVCKLLLSDNPRTGSLFRPDPGNTALLSDTGFIPEPDIDRLRGNAGRQKSRGGSAEVF